MNIFYFEESARNPIFGGFSSKITKELVKSHIAIMKENSGKFKVVKHYYQEPGRILNPKEVNLFKRVLNL